MLHFKSLLARRKPALSVIISIILISIIVSFSMGVALMVVDNIRRAADASRSKEANYAAESALEVALLRNKQLKDGNKEIGAKVESTNIGRQDQTATNGDDSILSKINANYKIDGTSASLPIKTVQGKYIIPAPFTGNVPWTGEGSKLEGGCDPARVPYEVDVAKDASGEFKYGKYKIDAQNGEVVEENAETNLINHPCNWNKIKVGERVSVPLYTIGVNGNQEKITDFILKVRTPCFDSRNEYCQNTDRAVLNCFDKGEEGVRCSDNDKGFTLNKKGEVILTWQVDAQNNGQLLSLIPNTTEVVDPGKGYENSSQLYEGLINKAQTASSTFSILENTSQQSAFKGIATDSTNNETITNFIQRVYKPVLKIAAVSGFVGCSSTDNSSSNCNPSSNTPLPSLPYLEYQIEFPSGQNVNPPNTDNVITVEGTSGAFTQSIQVKVPHESSQLEYVIQQ